MIKTSIEKMAEEIGFDIGESDNETQAKLLNGFCRGLANSMSKSDLNTQVSYIVDKLNEKSSQVLKEIVEYIKYKEDESKD